MSKSPQTQKPSRQAKPVPPPKEPMVVIENRAVSYPGKVWRTRSPGRWESIVRC